MRAWLFRLFLSCWGDSGGVTSTYAQQIRIKTFQGLVKDFATESKMSARMASTKMAEQFGKLAELEHSSQQNGYEVQGESNSVASAILRTASDVDRPVQLAKKILDDWRMFNKKNRALRRVIRRGIDGQDTNNGLVTQLTQRGMDADFKRVKTTEDMYTQKELQKNYASLGATKTNFKQNKKTQGIQFSAFTRLAKTQMKSTKDQVEAGAKGVKTNKKEILETQKALKKDIVKASLKILQAYTAGTRISKAALGAKFEPALDKSAHAAEELLEHTADQLGEKMLHDEGREKMKYAGVEQAAQRGAGAVRSAIVVAQTADTKESSRLDGESFDLGEEQSVLLQSIEESVGNVDNMATVVSGEYKNKGVSGKAANRNLAENLGQVATERSPRAQRQINEAAGTIQAGLQTKVDQLAGAVHDSDADADAVVRNVLEKLEPARQGVKNAARAAKAHAQLSSNTQLELSARVKAADMQRDRILRESVMAAGQAAEAQRVAGERLSREVDAGMQRYQRAADNIAEQAQQRARDLVQRLPERVHTHLSHMLRHLQGAFTSEDAVSKAHLSSLTQELTKLDRLLKRNPGSDDRLVGLELPLFVKHSKESLMENRRQLQALYNAKNHEELGVRRLLDGRMLGVLSSMRYVMNEERRLLRLRDQELVKAQMKEVEKAAQRRADFILAHNDMVTEGREEQEYMGRLVSGASGISDTFQESSEALRLMYSRAKDKLALIIGSKQAALFAAAERAEQDATAKVSLVVSGQRIADHERLDRETWPLLLTGVQRGLAYNLRRIQEVGGFLEQHFGKFDLRAQNKTAALKWSLQDTTVLAREVLAHAARVLSGVSKTTEGLNQLSDRQTRQFARQVRSVLKSQGNMDGILGDQRIGLLKSATGYVGKLRKKLVDELTLRLRNLTAVVGRSGEASRAAVRQAQQAVGILGEEVSAMQRQGKNSVKTAQESFRKVERVTKSELLRGKEAMQNRAQNTGDDMEVVSASYGGTEDRAGMVVDGLSSNADAVAVAQENAADRLAGKMEVAQKTMHAAIQAALLGFGETGKSAASKMGGWQNHMRLVDGGIYERAKGLDNSRREYEKLAGKAIQIFQSQVHSLQGELGRDVHFLDAYEKFTLTEMLQLVGGTGDLLLSTAQGADRVYTGMLDREFEFFDEASKLEGGEGFSKLKKIRNADVVIGGALEEDEALLAALQAHEQRSLPRLEATLGHLNEEHRKTVEERRKLAAGVGHVVEAKSDQLGHFVDAAAGEAGDNQQNIDQLGNTTVESAQLIGAGAKDQASYDNEVINFLNAEDFAQDAATAKEVAVLQNGTAAMELEAYQGDETIRQTSADVNGIKQANNQKLAAEKAETSQRFSDVMQKASGIYHQSAAEPDQGALLQSPRLASLLQESQQLYRQHAGLDQQQRDLGAEVERVVSLQQHMRSDTSGRRR